LLLRRLVTLLSIAFILAGSAWGQQGPATSDERDVLAQILTQTYYPSIVGKKAMGIGAETDVHRAGIVVVVQRAGLAAALDRLQIASTEIHGADFSLYRGRKDYDVPVGERMYVFSINVGLETVTFGMLTSRGVATPKGARRTWAAVTFYFPQDVLATAQKDVVFREIDSWFVPEGRSGASYAAGAPAAPAPYAPVAAAAPAPVPPPPPSPPASLTAGMSREQVIAAMGPPQREVTFQGKTMLTYPGMIVVLESGKLASVDQTAQIASSSKLAVQSDPVGADILMDGMMIGQTPSTFDVTPGDHQITVSLAGFQDWVRKVHVLAGSQINLNAKLEKK
jgi:hypothetical protein